MNNILNKIKIDTSQIMADFKEDQDITNENYLINYHALVTENIRGNNKKIVRNSFLMVLSATLYFILFFEESTFESISLIVGKIEDNTILFYFLPVVFSFLYLQNITLWNNNINLLPLFEKLSTKMFNLGAITDTVHIIKPFSFFHHLLDYQYENIKVNAFLKIPSLLVFLTVLFGPVLFNLFSIGYMILKNTYSPISIICFGFVLIFSVISVVQAFNSNKD